MRTYAFSVAPEKLENFINKAGQGDDLGGCKVLSVEKLHEQTFIVVIEREHDYPYVINQLRELAKWQAP